MSDFGGGGLGDHAHSGPGDGGDSISPDNADVGVAFNLPSLSGVPSNPSLADVWFNESVQLPQIRGDKTRGLFGDVFNPRTFSGTITADIQRASPRQSGSGVTFENYSEDNRATLNAYLDGTDTANTPNQYARYSHVGNQLPVSYGRLTTTLMLAPGTSWGGTTGGTDATDLDWEVCFGDLGGDATGFTIQNGTLYPSYRDGGTRTLGSQTWNVSTDAWHNISIMYNERKASENIEIYVDANRVVAMDTPSLFPSPVFDFAFESTAAEAKEMLINDAYVEALG